MAALARLTDNEKACLRRRLLSQTAKEMALELGVSPHAVEKRLKMARAKLGVSSSLHAARLLAQLEGYQQEGPTPPDLGGSASTNHPALHSEAQTGRTGRPRWSAAVIWGNTMIIILLGGALALGTIGTPPAPTDTVQGGTAEGAQERLQIIAETAESLGFSQLAAEQRRDRLLTAFTVKDRDRSRFIEAAEAPSAHIEGRGELADIWIAHHDSDRDGKVSRSEFLAGSFLVLEGPAPAVPAERPN